MARLLFERCEEEHSKALDAFHQAGPAGLYVSSMDDAQRWLTLDVNDDREVAFYLYDRRSGETRLLGKDASHTFADKLGRMQPVQYPARDGALFQLIASPIHGTAVSEGDQADRFRVVGG